MPLSTVRMDFVDKSGRFDLVEPDGSDKGANEIINRGQRLLDLLHITSKTRRRYFGLLTVGQFQVELESCRAIENVWTVTATVRTKLTERTLAYMRENYAMPFNQVSNALPTDWARNTVGLAPQQYDETTFTGMYGHEDIVTGDHYNKVGLLILPPSDSTYTLEVEGLFFSRTLDTDTALSYWTEIYPEMLVHASLVTLEGLYRNSQGVKDGMAVLNGMLDGLDNSMVDQEAANVGFLKNAVTL